MQWEARRWSLPTFVLLRGFAVFFQYLRLPDGCSGIQTLDLDIEFPLIAKVEQKANVYALGDGQIAESDFIREGIAVIVQLIGGIDLDGTAEAVFIAEAVQMVLIEVKGIQNCGGKIRQSGIAPEGNAGGCGVPSVCPSGRDTVVGPARARPTVPHGVGRASARVVRSVAAPARSRCRSGRPGGTVSLCTLR
jgi:hypothetical protein